MKKLAAAVTGVLLIILITYLQDLSENQVQAGNETDEFEYEYYYNDTDNGADNMNSISQTDISETGSPGADIPYDSRSNEAIDTRSDSITVFVNKEYSLPKDYVPDNLVMTNVKFYSCGTTEKRYMRKEAAKALEKMFEDASDDGIILYGVSGYRSYSRQKEIYNENVGSRGRTETNKVSATPGHSEHQTGLAIDISSSAMNGELLEEFGRSKEGLWVAEHCAKYGFIIRYPKDKENITGYSYEPWHIRYIGKKTAKYIMKNNITMEEYYGYTPSSGDAGEIVSDIQ